MTQNKKPVMRRKVKGIEVKIWPNEGENGTWFTTTITRPYKVGNQWKDSTSMSLDDLPIVSKLADMAFAWILRQRDKARTQPPTQNHVVEDAHEVNGW